MGASVRIDNKMAVFMRANEQAMERALERMGNDVFVRRIISAPWYEKRRKSHRSKLHDQWNEQKVS